MFKQMAAFLVAVCLLAGCSKAEMGYMTLAMEISRIEAMHVQGSLDISLNRELVESLPALRESFGDEAIRLFTEFGNYAELGYDGKLKINSDIFEADIDFYFKSGSVQERQYLCNLILKDNNLYIDSKGILNVYNLAASIQPEMAENIDSGFVKGAEGYEYILLRSEPGYWGGASYIEADDMNEAKELLVEVFKNFETGLIQQSGDIYRLQVNAPKLVDCLVRTASYLTDNSRYVYDTLNNNKWVKDNGGIGDYDSFAETLEMMNEYALLFRESFNEELTDPESELKHFKDSYYSVDLSKTEGVYHIANSLVGMYDGAEFCKVRNIMNITPKEVHIAAPESVKFFDIEVVNGVYEVEVFVYEN